ncbi:MAG: mucoidy inhibitor MuiA family protein [Myxococcota bacterium]
MLTFLVTLAFAGDYAEAAKAMMELSFDEDVVRSRLDAPAPAAAARSGATAVPRARLPLEPNSDVDKVVVFRDRALVTRVRTVEVAKGEGSVVFEGLPLGLVAESLEAQARDGDAKITGVELVSGAGEVEAGARTDEVKAEAKKLLDEVGACRDRIEALLAQREYLRGTLLPDGGGARALPTLDQMKGTLAFVGDAERDIAAKLRKELDAARELDEDIAPLLVKLDDPLATGMTVRVEVDAAKPGPATVALRYEVGGASWSPSYAARLDVATGRVTLDTQGVVTQGTGEDWTRAALFLSTADPARAGALPELGAWVLGGGYGGIEAVGYYAEADRIAPSATTAAIATDMSARVEGSGAVVFAIPGRRDVAGDASAVRLPIGAQTFASTVELATVPKVVPEVFRRARLRYDGSAPLLPGQLASFVGSDYVGAGAVDTLVPGEELSLAFGTDDRLRVERQLVSRTQERLGGKRVRYTFHFRVRLQNFAGKALEVLVTDQVPVSEDERVEVERLDSTPALPPGPEDPQGVLRWRPTVPANGEAVLDLRFRVTAPREVDLRALEALF